MGEMDPGWAKGQEIFRTRQFDTVSISLSLPLTLAFIQVTEG